MELSGITDHQFRSLYVRGKLKASKKTSFGEALYAEEAVKLALRDAYGIELATAKENAPESYTVEEARIVVRALTDGVPLGDLVLHHDINLPRIEAIAADYTRMNASVHIPPDVMRLIGKLPLPGTFPFPDPEEIYLVLKELVSRGRCQCEGEATLCPTCARRRYAPEVPARDVKPT